MFMAGLGSGSLYWGRRVDNEKNPLKTFGFLQLLIGISCSGIIALFSILPSLYKSLYHLLHVSTGASLILIFLISFVILFIPTFLMGGTFPVITKRYIETGTTVGQGTGLLYAINTLGAIIGVALTGYFLIGRLGQNYSQLLFVCINVALGCISMALAQKDVIRNHGAPATEKPDTKNQRLSPIPIQAFLIAAGVMGFCGLGLEILTTRALSVFLTNSSYNFTGILIVYLAGISVGSFIYTKFLSNKNNLLIVLGLLQGIIGLYIAATTVFLNDLPLVLNPLRRNLLDIPFFYFTLPGFILSSILLFIPMVCMGAVFPLLCKLFYTRIATLGSDIGKVYCANTLGSIAGPVIAAFVLIPLAGVSKGILIIALLCCMCGGIFIWFERKLNYKKIVYFSGASVLALSIPLVYKVVTKPMLLPPSIFRTETRVDSLAYYKETVEGTVVANKDLRTGLYYLYVNNTAVFGITYDAVKVVKMLAHVPFLILPEAKQALVIGFGTGITTAEMAKHPVQRIECVEICPGVKEAAGFFTAYNNNILNDPRVVFIDADGRTHLLLSDKKYDVISCDPSHPMLGSGNLYSKEYFTLCKNHCAPRGVVSQYLPMHLMTLESFNAIIKTFSSVFTYTSVWLGQSHCVLIGTMGPLNIDFAFLRQSLIRLNDNMFNDPYNVASSLFLDDTAARHMTMSAAVYKDDKPVLDYHSLQIVKDENWNINLSELMKYQINPLNHFSNHTAQDRETMARYIVGQEFFLKSLMKKNMGYNSLADLEEIIALLKKAALINPENSEITTTLTHELNMYARLRK